MHKGWSEIGGTRGSDQDPFRLRMTKNRQSKNCLKIDIINLLIITFFIHITLDFFHFVNDGQQGNSIHHRKFRCEKNFTKNMENL